MHDLSVRIASLFLCSGVLLFLGFLFYSAMYPRKAEAATAAPTVASRAKDYGLLAPLARPIEWTLREVEARLTHSWGWATVVTTFLINLILLPFRMLAARSARKMKILQPQVDAVNARYKASGSGGLNMDPEHSREISAIYSANHTSPLGGCIPGLAPFAILAAFYSVLTGIAQMRGACWLWIADLSRPEQVPVRILPLLMVATQLWIGRITPPAQGMDPKMARLMNVMPLIFGIVLYGQPAALMLYWVTSNLLQLAQQYWLARRYA
jgi:YidC/Oxa1 family membrane protein insertase